MEDIFHLNCAPSRDCHILKNKSRKNRFYIPMYFSLKVQSYVLICCDIHQFSASNSKQKTKSNMSQVGKIPFFTNLQCESAMPWEELTNQLEIGIKRFSNGEIEQPVRAMLPITEHSGFLGKFFFFDRERRELVVRVLS